MSEPLVTARWGAKLVSEANARGHWGAKHRRAHKLRRDARLALMAASKCPSGAFLLTPACLLSPLDVLIIRIAPCQLDTDNIVRAAKSVRDGVADWLGIDDRDSRVFWHYGQESGKPREYGCRIEIREGP